MPTIVAICPYCRAGGVRAPDTAIGASATCPKCKSSYTVLPEDDLPGWAASAKPDAKTFSADAPPKPRLAAPQNETKTSAAMPDRTEPSPVIPADAKPKVEAAPAVPAATLHEADDAPAASDFGLVCALGAMILVGPAVVASQLPFGRFIALGLAGVGLLGSLLCLGAEGRARLFAAGAASAHAVVIVLVLFLPSWLGLDPWRGAPAVAEEPKGPVAVFHATGQSTPLAPDQWLDAGQASWQLRDARVAMRAGVGPVELTGPGGAKKFTKKPYLRLVLQVRNVGYDREIPLSGWAAGRGAEGVRVTDSAGTALAPATFEAGWEYDAGKPAPRAMPGHASEVVLLFAEPSPKSEFVRVQLPGAALGAPGDVQFRAGLPAPARTPGK